MSDSTGRDLILAPSEYAYILNETNGSIIPYVGPNKASLSATDRPVVFNEKTKRFERCALEQAIHEFPLADEGWYIVLENPAPSGDQEHPGRGAAATMVPKLNFGRKINIPGPVSFPLWPGQIARVIQGHHLRSNQYLVVRVYNEEAARENWSKSVMKPQTTLKDSNAQNSESEEIPNLTMGKPLVIKGTDVSFYIPPTGIEALPDSNGNYVRNAETLERLEYCILLDESGEKRFVKGPDVVFPDTTETFVERDGSRKFKAIELNEDMGVFVKVISDYKDDDGEHHTGDELFITGRQRRIYFPCPEHAIIKYGDQEVHFAVVIPGGEARYVLNKSSGKVELLRGPSLFLADPRTEVIVRRVLDPKVVQLWYPDNQEALEYNKRLMELTPSGTAAEYVTAERATVRTRGGMQAYTQEKNVPALAGDDFRRKQSFTPPRMITLDTKYEGVPNINIWTGYAVLMVNKTGGRKVVVGPQTILPEYDETLEVLELSTGTPKSDDNRKKTVYLRVHNNKVSDRVEAETKDMVQVKVTVSYRVNFEEDENKWFGVENYVKFLTDHMRSMIRNAVKQHGIQRFNDNAINIIRDIVLGTAISEGKRPGRLFEENGMRIYDVEVLDVKIGDDRIAGLLVNAQHEAVQHAVEMARQEKRLEVTRRTQEIEREVAEAMAGTAAKKIELQTQEIEKQLTLTMAKIRAEIEAAETRMKERMKEQKQLDIISGAELGREKARREQELNFEQEMLRQRLEELKAEVEGMVKKANAISPDFIAALQAFSDRSLAEKAAQTMAPLAILGGKSVMEILSQLLRGTALEDAIKSSGVIKQLESN